MHQTKIANKSNKYDEQTIAYVVKNQLKLGVKTSEVNKKSFSVGNEILRND